VRGVFDPEQRIISEYECKEEVLQRVGQKNADWRIYFEMTNSNYDNPYGRCLSRPRSDEPAEVSYAHEPSQGAECASPGKKKFNWLGLYVCLNGKWTDFEGSPCARNGMGLIVRSRSGSEYAEFVCRKSGSLNTNVWRSPVIPIENREPCGTDSDCGAPWTEGDPYDWWNDVPDDQYWSPYHNGREWMNDPDDTWGDGR
jgi:hypothetical protein